MDLLGLNSQGQSLFIKHSHKDKCWMRGGEIIEPKYLFVDPSTAQTGWGMYDGNWNYTFDKKVGVAETQPSNDHRRAFSICIYIPDGPDKGPYIWRNFTWGECVGFNELCSLFWNDIDKNPGKVAAVEYKGSREEKGKVGGFTVPEFSFLKWTDKPADFVFETVRVEETVENKTVDFDFSKSEELKEDDLPF
jgi:hypothetical protein